MEELAPTAWDALVQHLEEREIHFSAEAVGEAQVAFMTFTGTNGVITCEAAVGAEGQRFDVAATAPLTAPEGRRLAVADFLNRVNWGLALGNLELDMEAGRIRYRAETLLQGQHLPSEFIDVLVGYGSELVDGLIPALSLVIHAGMSPADAYLLQAGARDEESN